MINESNMWFFYFLTFEVAVLSMLIMQGLIIYLLVKDRD